MGLDGLFQFVSTANYPVEPVLSLLLADVAVRREFQ
jgi:hypothetical protein